MSDIYKTISEHIEINSLLNWVDDMCTKGLRGGAVIVTLGREVRTKEQNSKGWPMWSDLSNQVVWHGERLDAEDFKLMLTAVIKKQRSVQGIDGGFVILSYSSRKLSKKEFSDLIELTYAFGTDNGVKWSEKSVKAYEKYRELSE